jgi:hypothetical protein
MEGQAAGKTRMSFSLRTLLELIAIVALIVAFVFQKADWLSNGNGRYQLHLVKERNSTSEILLDTRTGRIWKANGGYQNGRQAWISIEPADLGQPPSQLGGK